MIDVISDFTTSYDDFGEDAYINGASEPVKLILDEELELDDSALLVVRAMVTTDINRGDTLYLMDTFYKVSKVTPYGDQREENLVSLAKG